MPFTIWLAALAIATALPLAWWAIGGVHLPIKHVQANLTHGLGKVTDLRQVVLQQRAHDRVVTPAMERMARRARRITPAGIQEALDRRLVLAGIADRWPMERLLAMKLMLGVAGGVVAVAWFLLHPGLGILFLGALLTGLGFFGPDLVVDAKARERQQAIERELPDALDQMTVCVEAGLGFEAAVARTAEAHGALADELGRTLQDIQIGIPRARALENLLGRTDVRDLRTFVHAFSQAERFGIPMAHVLRVQAAEMREKRRQRAEERAMKIPVKLVFPVVLCILPALFVVVAGPAVVRLSHTSFGG